METKSQADQIVTDVFAKFMNVCGENVNFFLKANEAKKKLCWFFLSLRFLDEMFSWISHKSVQETKQIQISF